jgi:hypothetical protein
MYVFSERFGASSVVVSEDAAGVWKVSPRYTASRLLSVVALLRSALAFEGVCICAGFDTRRRVDNLIRARTTH